MSRKAVIVGAGPGGLATAMLLAGSGMEVDVLERLPHVGGRTSAIEADGFRFDLGPTFFLYPRVLEEIYEAAGFDLRAEVPMQRLDPQYRLIFGEGGELNASPDMRKMEEAIGRISPRDVDGFRRFMQDNRQKFELFKPCMERPYLGARDLLQPDMLKLLPALRPWESLSDDLSRYFDDRRLQLAFTFQSKYLGMSPFRCPSLFSILSFLEYEYGVYHPTGGVASVTRSMADVAEHLGVRIHLEEPVEEILFEGSRAVGARTPAGVYRGDAVVINADFARAMKRMIPDRFRHRWSNRRLEKKKFSCSTFMLYLGLEGQTELAHHNIFIARDYERNLREIEDLHVLSRDPSFYVQNPVVTDPSIAPEGMSSLYVLVPVTHQHPNVDWTRERHSYRELVLQRLARVGLEGIEERIRYEKIITPMEWDTSYEIHLGATFNLAHNYSQMLHLRPRNRFEDVDGVYLVGGGTHPGSGLPVIFESARISSRLLLEDLGMDAGWGRDSEPEIQMQEAV